MSRDSELVKKPPAAAEKPALRGGFRRHLQGYELGLLTVGLVLTFSLLALPRASLPNTLPLPRIDRAEAQRAAVREREQARRAEATGLPFELRAVGESIRHFGRSRSEGIDPSHDLDDLRERMKAVVGSGQSSLLLSLRAVQTEYFLRALSQFEREGTPNSELAELGGDFLRHAQHNKWFTNDRRFLGDEPTRRVLFHLHWADLIGKRGTFPFAPTLNDSAMRLDGTSMAAPHVSGAAATLMARHSELIGHPPRVKHILCSTATDLGRERYFQGHGLVDILRALQSM